MEKKCYITTYAREQLVQAELTSFIATLNRTEPDLATSAQIQKALSCIHAHLFDPNLNVAFVCRQCGLYNHNVSSHFKRAVGMGMRRYIQTQRLEAAKCLLQYEALCILNIAWSVGFTHPESFARAFKRYEGCTATQFRARV